MSGYLQRLLDSAAAAPGVLMPRQLSQSPLLALDQRLAVPAFADSIALGVLPPEGGSEMGEIPEATQIADPPAAPQPRAMPSSAPAAPPHASEFHGPEFHAPEARARARARVLAPARPAASQALPPEAPGQRGEREARAASPRCGSAEPTRAMPTQAASSPPPPLSPPPEPNRTRTIAPAAPMPPLRPIASPPAAGAPSRTGPENPADRDPGPVPPATAEPRRATAAVPRGAAAAIEHAAIAASQPQIHRPAPPELPAIVPEPPAQPDADTLRHTIAEVVRAELARQRPAQAQTRPAAAAPGDREQGTNAPLPQTAEAASVIGTLGSARRQTMLYGMRLR